jgi:hypothetical protein
MKPAHYLSMSCTELKWLEKFKVAFNKEEEKCMQMRLPRCSINDDYNDGMNGIDITDSTKLLGEFGSRNGCGPSGCGKYMCFLSTLICFTRQHIYTCGRKI